MSDLLEDFRNEFLQDVYNTAEVYSEQNHTQFAINYTNELLDSGVIDGFDMSYYSEGNSPSKATVDGYEFNYNDGVLTLFIVDFKGQSEDKLYTQDVNDLYQKVNRFFTNSLDASFLENLEESQPYYDLAYEIFSTQNNIQHLKLFILSSRIVSESVKPKETVKGEKLDISYQLWDISRLFRITTSANKQEDIIINFDKISEKPVYGLPAHLNTEDYKSYLVVLPGEILASIYDEYGTRLLEQNVRTFLQARGKVNKGIRTTIIHYPEKFFAYNNGLTTTAEKIEFEETISGLKIKSITNLQIVNGGQTTASIFSAYKKDKADLSDIFVQMKLTVIQAEKLNDFVPKISEFANSQNKVSAADFFSNHPFHLRIEEFSRRIYAPAREGAHRESKWFYERARGQYLDIQAYKTTAAKKKVLLEYPKDQYFTKTDLAKYVNVWDQKPHIVSKGAQFSFIDLANRVEKEWEKSDSKYNELYYKNVIAKAILFKSTEKIISQSEWYQDVKAYRAQTVAYSLSFLSYLIELTGKELNLMEIWKQQILPEYLRVTIENLTQLVNRIITDPPPGNANVGQWTKKEFCWTNLKKLAPDVPLPDFLLSELLNKNEVKEKIQAAKKQQKIYTGIEAQIKVFDLREQGKWPKIKDFAVDQKKVTAKELSLLDLANNPSKVLSEKQSLILIKVLQRLESFGFEID